MGCVCPCCGSSAAKSIGKLPDTYVFAGRRLEEPLSGGELCRCETCELRFRYPVLGSKYYESLYDNAIADNWSAEWERSDWGAITSEVLNRFPAGARVLDFGCYTGGLLARLDDRFKKYGVEINRVAAAEAMRSASAIVWNGLLDIPEGECFDVVIAADVVEHVENPKALIVQLMGLVNESGVLIVTTGDAASYWSRILGARWWYCYYPEHIAFVSEAWFEKVFDGSSFLMKFRKFRYFNHSAMRQAAMTVLACVSGVAPNVYRNVGRVWKMMRGRLGEVAPGGLGLGDEHILCVMSRTVEARSRNESEGLGLGGMA